MGVGRLTARAATREVVVEVTFDRPHLEDGKELWRLAKDSKSLDVNSSYFYVLWCRDFAATSVVARSAGGVCGFIAGFGRPDDPETLFVWQTAVEQRRQGQGLARRMLDHLAGDRFRYVEATVSPENAASDKFLCAFARKRGVDVAYRPLLGAELFPPGHTAETLYRIGPLTGGVPDA